MFEKEHEAMLRALVDETRANGGLAPVDLDRFWADQEIAIKDPFGADIPQVPLGIAFGQDSVFAELGIEEDTWRQCQEPVWAAELNRRFNDHAERIVGKRLMSDAPWEPDRVYPPVKRLHEIFEAEEKWHSGSWWIHQAATNEDELKALLDRVDDRDVRSFILPENWAEEKARLMALGVNPPLYRGQRGPVTFAMSVYGVENLIFLVHDNPDLAGRFRDTILRCMLEIGRVLDEEAGFTPETAPHGFTFLDDNSAMLTPAMYEQFAYPILKGLFDRYSPDPGDWRFQHSDSAMGHIMPLLARLNLNGANFGPTITVAEIRQAIPNAVIHGQLAPFTFMRNDQEQIVAEFLRDFKMAREKRGLLFATAGSVNNGSMLTSMRLVMAAIQRYGRY